MNRVGTASAVARSSTAAAGGGLAADGPSQGSTLLLSHESSESDRTRTTESRGQSTCHTKLEPDRQFGADADADVEAGEANGGCDGAERASSANDSRYRIRASSSKSLVQVLGEGRLGGRRGLTVSWQNVSVTVVDRRTGSPRCILRHACGVARPGRLLAVMGPSGAGKTTLVDVLAGNTGRVHANAAAGSSSWPPKRIWARAFSKAQEGNQGPPPPPAAAAAAVAADRAAGARHAVRSLRGVAVVGRVLVDGAPRRLREFRDMSCYVQQEDVLVFSATVREALTTAALLKLPYSVTRHGVAERVEAVIQELDLATCADTLIGNATVGVKGISGGQKRRVSVGIQLVKDPRVLFLDEPTSGLDSEAATSLVGTLRSLARMGRTVVATIHQPNCTISSMFDDFVMLACGRTLYSGPWGGAVGFFGACGFSCPPYVNPPEYFMSVVQDEGAVERLAAACEVAREQQLPDPTASTTTKGAAAGQLRHVATAASSAGAASASSTQQGIRGPLGDGDELRCSNSTRTPTTATTAMGQLEGVLGVGEPPGGCHRGVTAVVEVWDAVGVPPGQEAEGEAGSLEAEGQEAMDREVAPVWLQTLVLAHRYALFWIRTPGMLLTEVAQYAFYGFFFGAVFFRLGTEYLRDDFYRAACIWVSLTFMCFVPSTRAAMSWDEQRKQLKFEMGERLYGVNVYYLSRYLVLLPLEVAQTSVFVGVAYFLAGYYPSPGHFFLFVAVYGMCQVIGEGIGTVSSAVTGSLPAAFLLLNIILLLCVSFIGLLMPVPVYFEWAMYGSHITYAYNCLVRHEFEHLTFTHPATGQQVPGPQAAAALRGAMRIELSYMEAFAVLAGHLVGMELLKLLSFHYAVWRKLL